MRRTFRIRQYEVAGLLAAAVTMSVAANAQSSAQTTAQIVAFGASQTAGKGVSADEAYPAQLEALLRRDGFDVVVTNQGVSGDTVTDEARRIESAIPSSTRLVLYQPGSNDCGRKHQSSESDFRDAIHSTLSWMQAHHVQVLTLDSNCHFGVLEDETKKFGFAYYGKMTHGVGDLRQADGQHLTPEGYRKLAELLLPEVEQLLKQGDGQTPAQ
jgi:acyl-CoA thioesterase I